MSSDDGTIISWLQAAVTFLNPLRVWGHSVEPGRMVEFMQEMQPPPKKLRDAWDICVIPLRGEPTIAYMLRCLANHSITCLSPEFAVVTPDIMRASECPAFHESYGISTERCRVLSTRNDPDNPTFVQRGWHILTCESCLLRSDVVGNTELPIHYGGLNCVCCGASLPRVPAYYVATHCEVCCADGLQRLAVSFGESNQEVLQIGATVDVVMIRCQYSQGTNIVISNAVPVQHNPAGGLDYVGPLPGVPWTPRYYPRFDELVGHVAPNVMHNVGCKQITLMAAVHTLYRLRQKDGVYRLTPLHILITGPTRSGKSTILMAAQRMLGRHAAAHAILESATLGANLLPTPLFFERTKNHSRGAVAPSDVLLLDVMSEFSASDFWVMMFLLRYGTCSAGEQLSTTAVNPQIMAALHCTSRSAQKLQKYFSLVIPMQPPPSSAADNARMGQRVEHSSYPQPSSSRSRSASDRHSSRLAMEIKQTTTAGMDESLADLLEMMVCRCPEVHVLEQRIREALTILLIRFRTGENESGQSTDTSWLPLKSNRSRIEEAKFLLIVRELCLARLLIEGRSDVVWTDSMSQEVWTLYKLHTLGIETISRGLEESTGSKRSTGKRRARLAFVDELRRKQAKEANTVVTENAVKDVFEGFGGRDAMGDYLETILDELQQLGFLIRRQGGWHATKVT